jgi:DNA-binding transcriptional regulator YdaS (Cro superfamily)
MDKALAEAIRKIGNKSKLAGKLGVSHQAVSQWRRCPHTHVIEVEKLSGVPREELRPDLYPRRRFDRQ